MICWYVPLEWLYAFISVSVSMAHTGEALRCQAGQHFLIFMVVCMGAYNFAAQPHIFYPIGSAVYHTGLGNNHIATGMLKTPSSCVSAWTSYVNYCCDWLKWGVYSTHDYTDSFTMGYPKAWRRDWKWTTSFYLCLFTKSLDVSKPWKMCLQFSDRPGIKQTTDTQSKR